MVGLVGHDAGLVGANDRIQVEALDLMIDEHGRLVTLPAHARELEVVLALAAGGDDHRAALNRNAGQLDDRVLDRAQLGPVDLADLVVQEACDRLAGKPEDCVSVALGLQKQVLAKDTLTDRLISDDGQRREVRAVVHVGLTTRVRVVRSGQNQGVGVEMAVDQTPLEQEAVGSGELDGHGCEPIADCVVLEGGQVEDVGIEGQGADLVPQVAEEAQPGHLDGHAAVQGGGLKDLVHD